MSLSNKPKIAAVLGDPAGIGPELVAKLFCDETERNKAYLVIIADKDEVERGMSIAQKKFPYVVISSLDNVEAEWEKNTVNGVTTPLLFDYNAGITDGYDRAVATAKGGKYSLETLDLALNLHKKGVVDGIFFAPLNKTSLHAAGMTQSDELHWFADQLGHTGPICEFNTLDGLWTTRATSHVAIADVSKLITKERVIEAVQLIYKALKMYGLENPRVAVCGLNPHNGDDGNFGREEIDAITPALEEARKMGMPTDGPFPADTIFLKVFGKEGRGYDGVVTMYHDQGQIAIKLMGFSRGVTVQGGLPVPIATPAHGTAFDIEGKGVADVGATLQAFNVLLNLCTKR